MYLVAIGWLYVALMMAVAEANHSNGTVLGAVMTFLLYGLGPTALVLYILNTPHRKRALRAQEQQQQAQMQAQAPGSAGGAAVEPDAGGKAPAAAEGTPVAAVREEPQRVADGTPGR